MSRQACVGTHTHTCVHTHAHTNPHACTGLKPGLEAPRAGLLLGWGPGSEPVCGDLREGIQGRWAGKGEGGAGDPGHGLRLQMWASMGKQDLGTVSTLKSCPAEPPSSTPSSW